ncbi:MAG: endonuclease [Phycisphaerales bacterium]|nr:endonuclease [Phycisphaerales bacterium]
MRVRPCEHPCCTALAPAPARFCPAHEGGVPVRRDRDRLYDRYQRDPVARAFYNSAEWKRARGEKLAAVPWCERCRRAWAAHVHHRTPLDRCTDAERTAQANLESLCVPCHNAERAGREERT